MRNTEVFNFPQGIPGFEKLNAYKLLRAEEAPLAQLMSVEDEQIGFILIPPVAFFENYAISVDEECKNILKIHDQQDAAIEMWCIATINTDISKTTVNLRAPILLNIKEKLGMQLILSEGNYSSRTALPLEKLTEEGAVK